MPSVCFYFQVHQPHRLRRYGLFDIGHRSDYFDEPRNREIALKVAHKCYLPMNRLLHELIERHEGGFKVAFSITGTALEQFEHWCPDVLESFQRLVATGCVELLAETYHHSLAFLADRREFDVQLDAHRARIEALFGAAPQVFRNTELIFNNEVAQHVAQRGFRGVLAEGAERVLGWRSPHFVYAPAGRPELKLLLKSYRLSDDIAFRFGDRRWPDHPLSAEKFASWIHAVNGLGHVVNLFMDYETFGEHQWVDTGIFEFMRHLPREVLAHPDGSFVTPSEALRAFPAVAELDVPDFVSWADVERDLTAWTGNAMQRSALRAVFELREPVLASGDPALIESWRRLTTSDHFYYMCTKWFADGDVHKYFSPYESPYEAYIAMLNVLSDLALRAGCPSWRPPGD